MQKPKDREGVPRLRRRIVYHLAQLEAEPNFAELVEPSRALLSKLDAFGQSAVESADAVTRHLALRNRADRRADAIIDDFDLSLLKAVGRDRSDARYVLAYNGLTMSAIKRMPIEQEVKALRHLATALDEPGSGLESFKEDYQNRITQAADTLEAAEDALVQAFEAQAQQSVRRALLRLEVRRLLEKNYADILKTHPHDKDEVELYFLTIQSTARPAPDSEPSLDEG